MSIIKSIEKWDNTLYSLDDVDCKVLDLALAYFKDELKKNDHLGLDEYAVGALYKLHDQILSIKHSNF